MSGNLVKQGYNPEISVITSYNLYREIDKNIFVRIETLENFQPQTEAKSKLGQTLKRDSDHEI